MSGTKVQVDNFEIYYEKHGTGDHHLLLIPGILGQIINLFFLLNKFKSIQINSNFNLTQLILFVIPK